LINEKSPYLQQHAHNPVDWYPWGQEAFDRSRRENKPIFLSIGYSTCHWCHVMEHESFEDENTASLMNEYFVCVKVDREERPDVDRTYMAAVQAMTGSGGWPLSIFLTPALKPFYGGTYFPSQAAYGRPGFPTLLRRIHDAYTDENKNVTESADQLITFLQQQDNEVRSDDQPDDAILTKAFHHFAATYDERYAGFGSGPKFPRPVVFNFLFRYGVRKNNRDALSMSLKTLEMMARGGMFDHIGGGFHRYSVDGQWRVPHFEKMLYDQAQLCCSYLDAYQITKDEFYATVARRTMDYVLGIMKDPRGGFYSAEDADSPNPEQPLQRSEGAFYLWTKKEIEEIISSDSLEIFCYHYGVEDGGNVSSGEQEEFRGKNILFNRFPVKQTADFFSLTEDTVKARLLSARENLFLARSRRPRPAKDDKIIAGWNGLMISALAKGGWILSDARYSKAASDAAEFLLSEMYDSKRKILFRRYREGEVKFEAYLDDYAFVIQGLLDLYAVTFEIRWLKLASELQRTQEALFWDSSNGGFFDTTGKDLSILIRSKEVYDGAEPSGNSVAALNLLRLSALLGDEAIRKQAEKTIQSFISTLHDAPQVMPQMLAAMDMFFGPPMQIVIAGQKSEKDTGRMISVIAGYYLPQRILFLAEGGAGEELLARSFHSIKMMKPIDNKATVYVCENFVCELPTNDPQKLASILNQFLPPGVNNQ
jgi:uncharacterized protein